MNLNLIVWLTLFPFNPEPEAVTNPLSAFDPLWNNDRYAVCNSAASVTYLSDTEKEVIFILNMIRQHPRQFNQTVVARWPEKGGGTYLRNNSYYQSLVKHLAVMKNVPILQPDSLAWVSALCHAFSSGKAGYVGHDRQTALCQSRQWFNGECCEYGSGQPLSIVMNLLIDEDVPSLGHRIICLSADYAGIGVSHQPHSVYWSNTVLDFTR